MKLTEDEIISALEAYVSTKPNVKFNSANYKAYILTLLDLPREAFHAALMQCLRDSGPFIKSAGEIYQIAKTMIEGDKSQAAAKAWGQSIQEIYGDHLMFKPVDEIAAMAFKRTCTGTTLHNTKSEHVPFLRKQFIENYNAILDAEERQELLESGETYLRLESGKPKQDRYGDCKTFTPDGRQRAIDAGGVGDGVKRIGEAGILKAFKPMKQRKNQG